MEPLRLTDTQKCIHCGLCLQSCPTFVETGEEAHSPRGRIYSMRAVAEGRLSWEDIRPQIDSCLGCLACETACPSPVPYETMLEAARTSLESRRSPVKRFMRGQMLATTTDPHRMAIAAAVMEAMPWLGTLMGRLIGGAPLPVVGRSSVEAPAFVSAVGERRGAVTLLAGCVQRVALPEVNLAAARVLASAGYDVSIPDEPKCCGALMRHNGHPAEGKAQSERAVACWEGAEALVITSAGCGSHVKQYDRVLGRPFNTPVYDFAEFLVKIGWEPQSMEGKKMRLAMHDACHLQHGQGIVSAPRELLATLPWVETVELSESYCCGSAGVYNVFQPVMARRLLARKLDAILATEPDAVLSSNPGCTLWLQQGLAERGLALRVLHMAEVL